MELKEGIMEKIIPIVDEMGEERFQEYMKIYLELRLNKSNFFYRFAEYIDCCNVDKNGFKRISLSNFRSYLLGQPSIEELQEIWDTIEDPLDEFFGC